MYGYSGGGFGPSGPNFRAFVYEEERHSSWDGQGRRGPRSGGQRPMGSGYGGPGSGGSGYGSRGGSSAYERGRAYDQASYGDRRSRSRIGSAYDRGYGDRGSSPFDRGRGSCGIGSSYDRDYGERTGSAYDRGYDRGRSRSRGDTSRGYGHERTSSAGPSRRNASQDRGRSRSADPWSRERASSTSLLRKVYGPDSGSIHSANSAGRRANTRTSGDVPSGSRRRSSSRTAYGFPRELPPRPEQRRRNPLSKSF